MSTKDYISGSRMPGGQLRPPQRTRNTQAPRGGPRGGKRIAGNVTLIVLVVLAITAGSLSGLMLVYSADMPQIDELEHYRPISTTDLYDAHGQAFGSFALERRVIVSYDEISPILHQAVLSIEDKNFESHWGINLFRVIGAAYHDLTATGRAQGASTLTMQLARNLFLSTERSFARKVQEVFLSIQIERAFTKQQIFTLYANQIYLGHGMYGFEAGSQFYFSKHAKDLTLTEAALMAGLPKGPVGYSPLLNPERAFRRRNIVLNAMLEDGAITAAQANAAKAEPLGLHIQPPPNSIAPWFVEEVRRELEKRFGSEQVHEAGLRVYTTLDLELQKTANQAVLDGLAAYERRHAWKGRLLNVMAGGMTMERFKHPDWAVPLQPGSYQHALITNVLPYQVTARIGQQQLVINYDDWAWTGEKVADDFLKTGDIIYVRMADAPINESTWHATLEQDSGTEGALLAMDNASGDVLAMVGGRDFNLSQFNRAVQAQRQTGSSFKPYVYTAAVEEGARPEDMIVDSPATFATTGGPYTPHNYDGKYLGPITLLHALADSRNIPALRLAERVGIRRVIETAHRFGITSNIPAFLPVALGSVEVTLEEQVTAYSAFPNDGIRIAPRLIRKVSNADGVTLQDAPPQVTEATSSKTARTMLIFLQQVIRGGTGAAAAALNHPLGGKTGTTNDFTDAWFIGFSPSTSCGVWVGYDNRESLGEKETGARAALPIWMDFMKVAIAGKDNENFPGAPPSRSTPATVANANLPGSIKPASAVSAAAKPAIAVAHPAAGPSHAPTFNFVPVKPRPRPPQ